MIPQKNLLVIIYISSAYENSKKIYGYYSVGLKVISLPDRALCCAKFVQRVSSV